MTPGALAPTIGVREARDKRARQTVSYGEDEFSEFTDPPSPREAYEEGWTACRRHQSALQNPYALHPGLHRAWMNGYEDAEDHFRAQDGESQND